MKSYGQRPQQSRYNNDNQGQGLRGGRPRGGFGGQRDDNRGEGQSFRGGGGRGGYNGRGRGGYGGGDRQDRGGFNKENQYGGNREGGYQGKRNFDDDRSQRSGPGGFSNGGFSKKPNNSLVAISQNPEEAKVQKVQFFTNQFRMKIGNNAPQIYQYPLNLFQGLDAEEQEDMASNYQFTPLEVGKVVERERQRIELLIGKFIYSGFNIWTTQPLDQSFLFQSKLMGNKVTLKIDFEGEYTVNTSDIENPNRDDCQAMNQILNVIVKQAMSETGLLQFGQRPRFFDSESPINVDELNMQIWSGFKATAYKYSSGCNLIIDSCCRFMSTKSVLDTMHEMYDEIVDVQCHGNAKEGIPAWQTAVKRAFVGQSVIANYGTKRTYIVNDIKFDMGPCNTFFDLKDGARISVAKYFYKTYNMKITDKRQPMLIMNTQGRSVSLPSEFCLVDGVPDSIRNNSRAMRTLLNQVKQNPAQKLKAITGMVNKLFKMSKWAEWDIKIDDKPQMLDSRKLAAPELIHKEGQDKHLYANERLLKQMPVFSANMMQEYEFALVFDKFSRNEAENAKMNLMKCQGQLGMKCGKFHDLLLPEWKGNFNKLEECVEHFVRGFKKEGTKKPLFAVMILDKPRDYPKIKSIFTRKDIMSQVILKMNARKMNLSVASNVMKQINSKIGGDSVRMKMPAFVEQKKVMVIGIDVCHAGKKSVVGFAASKNLSLTQYYSDIIIQPKFQEIVKKDLDRCLINSIKAFSEENDGNMPGKIVIFRDGVGEGMRSQVIDKEIKQFKESLKPLYNKVTGIPPITLVVVNKRINQRMFVQGADGRTIENPPPGSIIDSTLVENSNSNKCYDYFLVPQQTTQGCVTPTHFFVALNESNDISKDDMENLTYTLCYMYSNWSGSIKVPAPCQYAHKIAEYHYSFDQFGMIKKQQKVDLKQLNYNEDFRSNLYYL